MPLITPKSFVYQESENNYDSVKQTIKGQQIVSLKKFAKAAPTALEAPDYTGQIGVGNKDDGSVLVYIANVGPTSTNGWDLISSGALGDEYANKDKANNFSNTSQTILNSQIPFIQQGFTAVDTIPIKGQGHIYIDMTDTTAPIIHMAVVATGGGYSWVEITNRTEIDNVALKNDQNNFKDGRQTILNQSIASINPSINRPANPVRSGEIYLQKANPNTGEKAKMWVSTSNAIGGFEWSGVSYSLDEDIVYRNVSNNFTNKEQKLMGKQLMSFASRGDQPPTGYLPDYDGQFYIAFKTLSTGKRDAAVWVANSQTWIPITSALDPDRIVLKDQPNEYSNANQAIKNGGELSQITGARIKTGGQSPIADGSYKATMLGEVCIYKNDRVVPSEISVWVAIWINPDALSNAGEWTMIYSSALDQTKIARIDKENTFEKNQKILGFGNQPYDIMKSRIVEDEQSPLGRIMPFSVGETFMIKTEGVPPQADSYDIYMAHKPMDSNSWVKLYDKPIDKIVRSNEKTFFTERIYIGDVNNTKKMLITGCREKKDGTVYNTTLPRQVGETVMCSEMVGNTEWIVIYMCAMDEESIGPGAKSRRNWIEIGRRKKEELIHR